MAYQIVVLPPSPQLADHVLFYVASRRAHGAAPPPHCEPLRFPAHMYASLTIVHTGRIRNVSSAQACTGSVLVGAMSAVGEREHHGWPEVTCVVFKPGRIGDFCRLPASDLTDLWADSRAVLNADEQLEISDRMAAQPTVARQILVLEQLLLARFARRRPSQPNDLLARALPRLVWRLPHMRVTELAAELGWGTRRLERQCLDTFGVGPKMLIRLARLQLAGVLMQRAGAAEPVLARVALQAGYADPSHFTRDAVSLAGYPPSVLRRLVRDKGNAAWGYAVPQDSLQPLQ